jgi:endonuclease YncB( thermonuclease family)
VPNSSAPRIRSKPAWLRILGALCVLAAGAAGYARVVAPLLQPRLKPGPQAVEVARLSDGDTLHLRPLGGGADIRLRLIGIDCPELGSSDGFRAAAAMSLLVAGASELELEPELTKSGAVQHDKYGRVLGWLWAVPGPDWPAQRAWLAAYPADGAPRPADRRVPRGRTAAVAPGRLLVQEELVALGCAELYRDAKGSKHYPRLASAAARR